MSDKNDVKQLIVIGGGPGGYTAAFYAADMDMDVTLIDPKPNPGGVCLYYGCIPSKALLHTAKVITEAKEVSEAGIEFPEPEINIDKLRAFKEGVVNKLTEGIGGLAKRRGINHILGKAELLGPNSLKVIKNSGETEELTFGNCIIATGSHPITIPAFSLDTPRIMTSKTALDLDDIPESLLVVGGGYIGLELGSVYSALGSEVSVVEMMPSLLPGADRDLVMTLTKSIKEKFEAVMVNTTVTSMIEEDNGIKVTFEGKKGEKSDKVFSKVLISVGRKPNNTGFGLKNTKIKLDDKGFIKVDPQRKTAEPSIYAIGDIAGEPMLAHKASHEGKTAVDAIAGKKTEFNPAAIPAVVFTDPEVAWCGLTDTQAKKEGINCKVAKFPWGASGRAASMGISSGVTKLLIDPESGKVLGMGIAGPGAGEMIAEGVLAIEMGATVKDIEKTIHPHPTLSETIMEAAEVFFGHSTHVFQPKRKR